MGTTDLAPKDADQPDPRRWFCAWHDMIRNNPHDNTIEEFEAFWKWQHGAGSCSAWTHHPAGVLWEWAAGNPVQHAAEPCGPRCSLGPAAATETQTREFRAAVREDGGGVVMERPEDVLKRLDAGPGVLERRGLHRSRVQVRDEQAKLAERKERELKRFQNCLAAEQAGDEEVPF